MQSYQRFQCIGHMGFKGLSNAVTNTHPLLPSMGTTRQKSSCRNGLQNGPRLLSRVKAGTLLAFANRIAHSGLHAETGAFRTGPLSLPSERSARSQISPGRVSERRTLPRLGLGRRRSRRTQRACGAAMRLRASLLRGVAAPLGCVIFLQFGDVAVFSLCAQYFLNVRGGGGITTLGGLCVLLKYRTAACQNGSFAVF